MTLMVICGSRWMKRSAKSMDLSQLQERIRNEYFPTKLCLDDQKLNCGIGLSSEAGEVLGLINKEIFLGRENMRELYVDELGDTLWFVVCMANVLGLSLEEIVKYNEDKLRKRYPDGRPTDL
jgi:NTP pyrophosphatase (non-canonical NTP hydrolase)